MSMWTARDTVAKPDLVERNSYKKLALEVDCQTNTEVDFFGSLPKTPSDHRYTRDTDFGEGVDELDHSLRSCSLHAFLSLRDIEVHTHIQYFRPEQLPVLSTFSFPEGVPGAIGVTAEVSFKGIKHWPVI